MSLRCAGQTLISSGSRLVRPTDRCRLPPRPTPIPERVAVGVPDSDGCGEECVTCGAETHRLRRTPMFALMPMSVRQVQHLCPLARTSDRPEN